MNRTFKLKPSFKAGGWDVFNWDVDSTQKIVLPSSNTRRLSDLIKIRKKTQEIDNSETKNKNHMKTAFRNTCNASSASSHKNAGYGKQGAQHVHVSRFVSQPTESF